MASMVFDHVVKLNKSSTTALLRIVCQRKTVETSKRREVITGGPWGRVVRINPHPT
jgi:hypothetical protein